MTSSSRSTSSRRSRQTPKRSQHSYPIDEVDSYSHRSCLPFGKPKTPNTASTLDSEEPLLEESAKDRWSDLATAKKKAPAKKRTTASSSSSTASSPRGRSSAETQQLNRTEASLPPTAVLEPSAKATPGMNPALLTLPKPVDRRRGRLKQPAPGLYDGEVEPDGVRGQEAKVRTLGTVAAGGTATGSIQRISPSVTPNRNTTIDNNNDHVDDDDDDDMSSTTSDDDIRAMMSDLQPINRADHVSLIEETANIATQGIVAGPPPSQRQYPAKLFSERMLDHEPTPPQTQPIAQTQPIPKMSDAQVELLNQKAIQHVHQAEYDLALREFNTVLQQYQLRHGNSHPLVASAHHNLGTVHSKRAGLLFENTLHQRHCREQSLKCFQAAARAARDSLGPSHPNVAVSLVRIGFLLLQSRQYENAVVTFQEALRIRTAHYGPKHGLVANLYNNLGVCHMHLGNYAVGRQWLDKALALQRNFGDDTRDLLELADTLCNIGGLCLEWIRMQGPDPRHATDAESAFAEALEIRTAVLGPSAPMVLQVKALLDMARAIPLPRSVPGSPKSPDVKATPPLRPTYHRRNLHHQQLQPSPVSTLDPPTIEPPPQVRRNADNVVFRGMDLPAMEHSTPRRQPSPAVASRLSKREKGETPTKPNRLNGKREIPKVETVRSADWSTNSAELIQATTTVAETNPDILIQTLPTTPANEIIPSLSRSFSKDSQEDPAAIFKSVQHSQNVQPALSKSFSRDSVEKSSVSSSRRKKQLETPPVLEISVSKDESEAAEHSSAEELVVTPSRPPRGPTKIFMAPHYIPRSSPRSTDTANSPNRSVSIDTFSVSSPQARQEDMVRRLYSYDAEESCMISSNGMDSEKHITEGLNEKAEQPEKSLEIMVMFPHGQDNKVNLPKSPMTPASVKPVEPKTKEQTEREAYMARARAILEAHREFLDSPAVKLDQDKSGFVPSPEPTKERSSRVAVKSSVPEESKLESKLESNGEMYEDDGVASLGGKWPVSTATRNEVTEDEMLAKPEVHLRQIHEQAKQYLKRGRLSEAQRFFKIVLECQRRRHGPLHEDVAAALHNVGLSLLRQSKHEEALSSFEEAVRVRKGALGRDHPLVAVSLVKVGITLLLLHRFEEALWNFRDALSVRKHALGALHPSTARIYNNIGCVHVEFKECREARRAFEAALDIQRNAIIHEPESGPLKFGCATTLCNLGYLYSYRDMHERAVMVLKEASELQEEVLGKTHPTVLSTLDNLAEATVHSGEGANAIKVYQDILTRFKSAYSSGSNRRRRAEALLLYKMSKAHQQQNDGEAQLEKLTEALDVIRTVDEAGIREALEQSIRNDISQVQGQLKKKQLDWI